MEILRAILTLLAALGLVLVAGPAPAAAPVPEIAFSETKVRIAKIEIRAEVSLDEAVESLKLRANQLNLKFVGGNALYKEIEALTGKPARRMEIFNFCDGLAAQQLIAADSTLIAFMPCRIAVVEDARGARWIIAMMMAEASIAALPEPTRSSARRIMAAMQEMMRAAASGDL